MAKRRSMLPPRAMAPRPQRVDEDGTTNGDDDAAIEAAAAEGSTTLGARARALRLARGRAIDGTTVNAAFDADGALDATPRAMGDGGDADGKGRSGSTTARADSLSALLSQALRADDAALIERCLSVNDRTTIANTVSRLSASNAMKLLSECAARAQAKPGSGERCARWARTILLHHAGYASSAPKARATLLKLSQTIESHVSMQGSLQALLGRLELVLHASASTKQNVGGVDVEENDGVTTVYDEATDAVDVLQDVMGGAGEEGEDEEWETDEDGESEDDDDDDYDDEDDDDDDDDEDDDMV